MSNTLNVKVRAKRSKDGEEYFEGLVAIPGTKPTKLVRKVDGTTKFSTRAAVNQAAKNLGKNLALDVVFEKKTEERTATRKAAKKSLKAKTDTTGSCSGDVCSPPWLAGNPSSK
ncbi:MAG: hypothetical protein ACREGR_01150 [Minisyncoccia bacterium]